MIELDEEAGCGSTAGNGGSGSKSQYLAGSRRLRAGWICSGLGSTAAFSVNCIDASAGASGKDCAEAGVSWRSIGGDCLEVLWKMVTPELCVEFGCPMR
jgi:hypothetical protein